MKIKDIELFNISRYRGELMGISILFIILFHVYLPRTSEFFGLHRMGNFGVDIFFFLSGMGLWFSWAKVPHSLKSLPKDWLHFYSRRLLRIYPAWLLVACLFYIPRDITWGGFAPSFEEFGEALGDILINWDFWLHDELTFWYVPATMMLYIFAPPYMELIRRQPIYRWLVVLMLMWPIMVQYITPIHNAVGHIEIFWSRVPIFFLGINIGESIRRKDTISGQSLWLILLLFIVSFSSCVWLEQMRHGKFPLYTERMLYIPFVVTSILLLSHIFAHTPRWFNKSMAWVGAISLEIYLIHIEFIMKPLQAYHLGYWPTALLTIAASLPLAYILQKVLAYITLPLNKIINHPHRTSYIS